MKDKRACPSCGKPMFGNNVRMHCGPKPPTCTWIQHKSCGAIIDLRSTHWMKVG